MRYLKPIAPHLGPPADYKIEDGVLIDHSECPTTDRHYNELTRYHHPSGAERKAEEIAWASRSGPVYTIKEGRP